MKQSIHIICEEITIMKTGLLFGIAVLLTFTSSFAQPEQDFCRHFSFSIRSYTNDDDSTKQFGGSPKSILIKEDRVSEFIEKHPQRFSFLLWNTTIQIADIFKLYPDTVAVHQFFCDRVINTTSMQHNLQLTMPLSYFPSSVQPETYTQDELMQVAAHFFYCDGIDSLDTTVASHIFVGINGFKELPTTRDYRALAAISLEAIFYYMHRKKTSHFMQQFRSIRNNYAKQHVETTKDWNTLLIQTRAFCFQQMAVDVELKRLLLRYIKRNKHTMRIQIKD